MICNCEDIETMFLKDHRFTTLVKETDKVWKAAEKHPIVVTRQKQEGTATPAS